MSKGVRPSRGGTTIQICKSCDTSFTIWKHRIGERKYCSRKCYLEFHTNRPKIQNKCLTCSNDVISRPSEGYKFCGHTCQQKYRWNNMSSVEHHRMMGILEGSRSIRPTSIEKKFTEICLKNNLPFTYIGNGEKWIGRCNPDFIHTQKQKVIEIAGRYWHDKNYEKNRSEYFAKYGYSTMVIWDRELEDENKVLQKIKEGGFL